MSYDDLAYFAQTWGLVYLMVIFFAVVVYAFLPANKKRFDRAARQPLEEDGRPWR